MESGSDETFDIKFVKIIMNYIDFKRPLIIFLFAPYCIYMALVLFYFCYTSADSTKDPQGFLQGKNWEVTVRMIIFIFTIYWFILEIL